MQDVCVCPLPQAWRGGCCDMQTLLCVPDLGLLDPADGAVGRVESREARSALGLE